MRQWEGDIMEIHLSDHICSEGIGKGRHIDLQEGRGRGSGDQQEEESEREGEVCTCRVLLCWTRLCLQRVGCCSRAIWMEILCGEMSRGAGVGEERERERSRESSEKRFCLRRPHPSTASTNTITLSAFASLSTSFPIAVSVRAARCSTSGPDMIRGRRVVVTEETGKEREAEADARWKAKRWLKYWLCCSEEQWMIRSTTRGGGEEGEEGTKE
jgi:hypothetical protein